VKSLSLATAKKKALAILDKFSTITHMSMKRISEKVGNVVIPIYPTASNGYSGFTVAWYEAGKRCRRFFAREADARKHARLVATKIENQERQALSLKPEDARIYVDALSVLKPFSLSLDSAVRETVAARKIVGEYPLLQALQFWKRHHDDAIPEKRVADVVTELVNGLRKDGRSESHVAEMERVLQKFADTFQTNIGSITTADINAYLRGLKTSPASRNIYRRKIVTLFNYARRVGYLPDKTTAATNAAKAKEHGREIEIYSAEEMSRLLQHASDNLRPFVVLCGFCGLRPAEAMRLDWKEIDFASSSVLVSAGKSKTQSRRFAPLPENAAAWLRPHAEPTGKVVNVVMIINALRHLGKRARVTMKRNGLRHSFCSYRLAITQNANQTALEAGHSADILFRHYRQLCTEAEAKRWFSITPSAAENVIPLPTAAVG
jgi:integrase